MTNFDNAFRVVIGEEGGYTANPADPGNWTGGRVGAGRCIGTKYGIAGASYPHLDIPGLVIGEAKAIYKADYWDRIRGDELPPAVALLVFDAAINSGPARAVFWLQQALRVKVDGQIGPITLGAARRSAGQGDAILAEYQSQRLLFLTNLPTWRTFAPGWSRRVFTIQFEAMRVGGDQ